jgi:hypothetical protein
MVTIGAGISKTSVVWREVEGMMYTLVVGLVLAVGRSRTDVNAINASYDIYRRVTGASSS